MALELYSHPDGGHYVVVDDFGFQMKMDDGRWEPGVLYRRVERGPGPSHHWQYVGPHIFGTTKKRWADRFTKTGETTARGML
jgi:hypothetical protein